MTDNARKAVLTALVDTWTQGPQITPLFTDLGPAARPGDSIDIPQSAAATVYTSEVGAVETVALSTTNLTVDRPKFVNVAVGNMARLTQLDGSYAEQVARSAGGDLWRAIERDLMEHLIRDVAGTDAANHVNVAAATVTDTMANDFEKIMLSQDGIADQGLAILASPSAAAALKSVAEYIPSIPGAQQGVLGIPSVRSLNGIPMFRHNGVPGDANPLTIATSAVTVAANVATATVAAGHGFVAGQKIYTTGLTTNVAKASAVAITSVTATTIVYPLTAGDGALADGVGSIVSASGYALLVYGPRAFYAFAGMVPEPFFVKREGNAGFSMQLVTHLGRKALAGSCKILHTPL